jgi:hypothetical protein
MHLLPYRIVTPITWHKPKTVPSFLEQNTARTLPTHERKGFKGGANTKCLRCPLQEKQFKECLEDQDVAKDLVRRIGLLEPYIFVDFQKICSGHRPAQAPR